MDIQTQAKRLQQVINDAGKILLIASTPVDSDSAGTTLGLKLWLERQGKQVTVNSYGDFARLSNEGFPPVESIIQVNFAEVDFEQYDLICIIDASGWLKAVGGNHEEVLPKIPLAKTWLIDHHSPAGIVESLGENVLQLASMSTVETLYWQFFKALNIEINQAEANLFYYAHINDTAKYTLISEHTFEVANELVKLGADHNRFAGFEISVDTFHFTGWAIEHTLFWSEAKTLVVTADYKEVQELERRFHDWGNRDLDSFFKNYFLKRIKEHYYGITLYEMTPNEIDLRWRTKEHGDTIALADVFKAAGFDDVGGHRNAGGGTFKGTLPDCLAALKTALVEAVVN
jgi:nanoRNase/pAp phosphatase (c-di-AMP/oligoRNAs hydrolase)